MSILSILLSTSKQIRRISEQIRYCITTNLVQNSEQISSRCDIVDTLCYRGRALYNHSGEHTLYYGEIMSPLLKYTLSESVSAPVHVKKAEAIFVDTQMNLAKTSPAASPTSTEVSTMSQREVICSEFCTRFVVIQ